MGVDVGSPALHEIPTTSVVSSSGQARKSCEGEHLSHEESTIYSQVPSIFHSHRAQQGTTSGGQTR